MPLPPPTLFLGFNIHKVPFIIPEYPVNKVPWDKVPQVAAWPRQRHLRGRGTVGEVTTVLFFKEICVLVHIFVLSAQLFGTTYNYFTYKRKTAKTHPQ